MARSRTRSCSRRSNASGTVSRRTRRLPRRRRGEHRDARLVRSGELQPALERASGRRVGESLGLCYSPEFIALGNVIRDMLEPDMVLIGESDRRAGDVLERLYAGVCENDPPFRRMSLVNAELTKIAVNTYVTMKISYANTLADMCERLPGADVESGDRRARARHADRQQVPPRRDRLRRPVLPARQQGVRRARARPRHRARRSPRRRTRSTTPRPSASHGSSVAHLARRRRGRDPRARLQAGHRSRRGEPRRRARVDPRGRSGVREVNVFDPVATDGRAARSRARAYGRAARRASCSSGPTWS